MQLLIKTSCIHNFLSYFDMDGCQLQDLVRITPKKMPSSENGAHESPLQNTTPEKTSKKDRSRPDDSSMTTPPRTKSKTDEIVEAPTSQKKKLTYSDSKKNEEEVKHMFDKLQAGMMAATEKQDLIQMILDYEKELDISLPHAMIFSRLQEFCKISSSWYYELTKRAENGIITAAKAGRPRTVKKFVEALILEKIHSHHDKTNQYLTTDELITGHINHPEAIEIKRLDDDKKMAHTCIGRKAVSEMRRQAKENNRIIASSTTLQQLHQARKQHFNNFMLLQYQRKFGLITEHGFEKTYAEQHPNYATFLEKSKDKLIEENQEEVGDVNKDQNLGYEIQRLQQQVLELQLQNTNLNSSVNYYRSQVTAMQQPQQPQYYIPKP
eukprot:TRINITY_DN1319_c0_g3_i2.p1 TRINITY_DN1319_c0_g3~~TRINITY_DN1319_c0_g3_i2.p1  ORF type:complete len:381 (-),score=103.94 TRINITY_DN1319_c0_g3_i2:206-1348(-)